MSCGTHLAGPPRTYMPGSSSVQSSGTTPLMPKRLSVKGTRATVARSGVAAASGGAVGSDVPIARPSAAAGADQHHQDHQAKQQLLHLRPLAASHSTLTCSVYSEDSLDTTGIRRILSLVW